MEANYQLLRYNISDWSQLPMCRSNTNKDLDIEVTQFVKNRTLNGTRISIKHPQMGVLFSTVVGATGEMITASSDGEELSELTVAQILTELMRYGFNIQYNPVAKMNVDLLQFLMTIRDLNFDKIRVLDVRCKELEGEVVKRHVVAFMAGPNPYWLNNLYQPTEDEYIKSLQNGSAFNVSNIAGSKFFSWNWLEGWVADINDILREASY